MQRKYSPAELEDITKDSGITREEAVAIVANAIDAGKITTKTGRQVGLSLMESYYLLRFAATGSVSHQFGGILYGDNPGEDERIRAALWVLYRTMKAPKAITPLRRQPR